MNLLPYGPRALLAEFSTLDEVMAAATHWRVAALPGVVEIVPAARSVLVVHDDTFDAAVLTAPVDAAMATEGPLVEMPVVYDGDDLDWVAEQCHLTPAQVVELHSSAIYTCAFCGFMPGFSYLVGLPDVLHLPRRATPRTRVPAGSVAIASEFTAIYPAESPGGWHLLGTTRLPMWDDARDPAATLPPGTRVRFVPS
ncbi:MAG: 5-oxoprolinase subunit PxpB [Actinobacteria bacterium]|nr:5-oxoprolinase subunit PxpB [Actinomycetota bacterium]